MNPQAKFKYYLSALSKIPNIFNSDVVYDGVNNNKIMKRKETQSFIMEQKGGNYLYKGTYFYQSALILQLRLKSQFILEIPMK